MKRICLAVVIIYAIFRAFSMMVKVKDGES